jgi:hypothetical protein
MFKHGRYANVTATLALVVALAGTSYAAVTITGRNIKNGSIKAVDLGRNSVTSVKVKNGTLRSVDFKRGQLPAGPRGATGPKGEAGPPGAPGAAVLPAQLAAGQTLRGYVELVSTGDFAGDLTTASVSFPFPLPAAPTPHFIESGAANPAGCAGSATNPSADPGHLCVYEIAGTLDGEKRLNVSRFGFGVELLSLTPPAMGSRFSTTAVWAVSAA